MNWQPAYEGKLRRRRPGMPKGHKYPIETCRKCGRQVPGNWMVRHLKSGCAVPRPRVYEAVEP